jgi:hypothetical protein
MGGDEVTQDARREERRVAREDEHVVGLALDRGARRADRTASPVPSG